MDSAVKWIGGATAAVFLLFGGAMLAGNSLGMAETDNASQSPITMPSDSAGVGASLAGQAESQPVTQPVETDHFVIKRILPINGPIKYGEWHWDDEGVPDGPLLITVDLDARVISVFKGGYEIGAAAVLLGTDDHPTPLGTFPILLKKRHNVSTIYGAPMPYTMRLTNDGVAIHASEVENGYASHGCIGTPDGFASRLFAIAQVGDKVVITRGKMVSLGDSLGG